MTPDLKSLAENATKGPIELYNEARAITIASFLGIKTALVSAKVDTAVMLNGDEFVSDFCARKLEEFCNVDELLSVKIHKLLAENEKMKEALRFYAQGGNENMDRWQHPDLGSFIGKRARECLGKLEQHG